MKNEWLSAREISEILNISIPTVHTFVKKGLIPAWKYNHRIKVHYNDFVKFLRNSKTDGDIKFTDKKIKEFIEQREKDWEDGLFIPTKAMKHNKG